MAVWASVAEVMAMNSRRLVAVMLAVLVLTPAVLSGAVVADTHADDSTETPTETAEDESGDDTSDGDGDGSASDEETSENESDSDSGDGNETETREADVAITQSKYVSSAPDTKENEKGRTVHEVTGRYIWLNPQNFDTEEVSDVYISSDSAEITHEQSTDRYLVTANEDGTYQVTFQVEEEHVVRDGNTSVTETRPRTYTTYLSVDDTGSSLASEDVRENADRWDSYSTEIEGIYGEGVDVVAQTNAAFEFHKFKANPMQYALESPFSAATMLFITFGGWVIIALFIMILLVTVRGTMAYVRKHERTAGARQAITEMIDEIEKEHIKQDLSGVDVHDAYADASVGDTVRRALGNASSMWDAFLYLVGVLDERSLTEDRLKLMGATGHAYQASRDDAGEVTDVTVQPDEEFNLGSRNLMDVEDDVVDWIFEQSPDDHAVWDFNLKEAPAVDFDTELRIENDVDTVLDRLAQMVRTPEKKRRRIQMFAELLVYVQKHPHTDSAGRTKGLRWVVSGLTQLSDHISDRKSIPIVKVVAEHFYYLNNTYRAELEVDEDINAVQNGDIDPRDTDD